MSVTLDKILLAKLLYRIYKYDTRNALVAWNMLQQEILSEEGFKILLGSPDANQHYLSDIVDTIGVSKTVLELAQVCRRHQSMHEQEHGLDRVAQNWEITALCLEQAADQIKNL